MPCGLTWGADVADMEELAIWNVGPSGEDNCDGTSDFLNSFLLFFVGGFDMSTFRYRLIVLGPESLVGKKKMENNVESSCCGVCN